jgi:GNAT superfamily N-acetyltransferase
MEIFEATFFDLKQLSALFDEYRVFYGKESDIAAAEKFISERVKHSDSVIYITTEDDELTGFVQLYPLFSSVQMKKLWLLNDLYVTKEHRRKGVAMALIEKSKHLAVQTDAAGLMLETSKNNNEGNRLYLKEGFDLLENNFYYWPNTFAKNH